MKLKDFLDQNKLCKAAFARAMISPALTKQNLNHRIQKDWDLEIKKGGGIVMRSPDGKNSIFHEWDESCLKK